MEKFGNSLRRSHLPVVLLRGVSLPDAFDEAKRTAVLFHSAEQFRDECCRVGRLHVVPIRNHL